MALAPIGVSSYPSQRGVEQYLEARAAAQLNALNDEFEDVFGYRFSPNEGVRSRARQKTLREAWEHYLRFGSPFANLAAVLYTSTHDVVNAGNAVDIGVTRPDGSNRALTQVEHDWIVERGARRGVVWTGRGFSPREGWHFNVFPARAIVAAGFRPIRIDPEETDMSFDQTDREALDHVRVNLHAMKLIQSPGRGIGVVGPGHAKILTPEELPYAIKRYGYPAYIGNDREFDLEVTIHSGGIIPAADAAQTALVLAKLEELQAPAA